MVRPLPCLSSRPLSQCLGKAGVSSLPSQWQASTQPLVCPKPALGLLHCIAFHCRVGRSASGAIKRKVTWSLPETVPEDSEPQGLDLGSNPAWNEG